ncbi:MAG TPA: hypothetical protein PLL80_01115 [Candidatus Pacearchaeota archaeon]|nr:hypothetical protein [Candidatus Pacearchaeota archaeon]HOK94163.1 hypothetical protein [Candidatus Pacearchaeota archaeon]HPO75197.1 hypothetical protein [Candidatus Pacearchaeota archaeon]
MSKTYLSILIIIALIVIGSLAYSFISQPKIGTNEAVVIIDFGNNKRAFAGEVIDGMTITDALGASAKAGNFNYIYQNGTLEKVDGLEKDGGQWSVFINGTKVEEPLDKITIKPQDKIELRFEK